jgi:valyl-tRNA synthetase
LDDDYTKAIQTVFLHYWQKGYIYRGPRIVNWCPRCSTAISDIEIKYREEKSKLWFIRYPLKRDANIRMHTNDTNNFVVVATTRPETMLGDTAVAVNPKDERYKNLIGRRLILPIMNREIPIIAHRLIDQEFGTGAVKVTPAHDATDWRIGKENKLAIINVIGPDAKMTKEAGKYAGLPVLEARKKIVEELKSLGLLEKEEEYLRQVPLCDRCGSVIEPQISTQWFVKMDKLAKPAIEAVKKDKVKILPRRYKKIYLDWLGKVADWCISRQLWWGHRMPVWFCQAASEVTNRNSKLEIKNSSAEDFVVSVERPKKCPFCGKCEMERSADVLDTWFSSALWPFATMGWPASAKATAGKPEKTDDLKNYYPTDFLTTAQDIFYLWVTRMVFSSLEFLKQIPFDVCYVHATVLNIEGQRMSKSLGTGLDPLDLIDKYGADASRLGMILQTSREQQAIKFDERTVLAARNFVNKLWNISRFVEMQSASAPQGGATVDAQNSNKIFFKNFKNFGTLADKWILSRLNAVIDSVANKIKNYEFGEAARELYDFTWHEFADWYLEITKTQMSNVKTQNSTIQTLNYTLDALLKLLYPFIPFVTEEIYSGNQKTGIRSQELLMIADWPKAEKKYIDKKAEKEFEGIKETVVKIRAQKAEQKIPLSQIIDYKLTEKKIGHQKDLIENLAKVKIQNE